MPFYPKYTQKDVEEIVANEGCVLLSSYNGRGKDKIKLKCRCGNEFETTFEKFLIRNKKQCNACGRKRSADGWRKQKSELYKTVQDLGYSIVRENYNRYTDSFVVKCQCGFVFETSLPKLRNSLYACPKCRHERMVTINSKYTVDFIKEIMEENGSKLLEPKSGFVGTKSDVKFVCSKCGAVQKTNLGYLLESRKFSCNSCSYAGKIKSYGEVVVKKVLDDMGLKYQREYSFQDCRYKYKLRFDFAVFLEDKIFLIEFDGKQHFEKNDNMFTFNFEEIILRDKIKNNYCAENGIPLLRIRYDEIKWVKEKVQDFLGIW